jgi:hypothetical protein
LVNRVYLQQNKTAFNLKRENETIFDRNHRPQLFNPVCKFFSNKSEE